jgi:hypothetical protein
VVEHSYLTLVLVCVDKLRPVTSHLGLAHRILLSRSIQSDLEVLNIGVENRVKVTRERSRYDLKLLSSLRRC